jgi:class III poly(R)-hydroxyalkanoic acid synthase PhaE subunit
MMAENENADNSQKFTPEQAHKMFDFWTDTLKLPTIGPIYAYSKDFGSYFNDFVRLGEAMVELKANMERYWSLMTEAHTRAMKEMIERAPKQLATKEDFENYRRVAIEVFEDTFTELFTSPQFSEVYGKLFGSQLNLSRSMQSIVEKNFKMLNLPTRSEVDVILKEIMELKRTMRDLRRSVETRNDQARFAT